MPDPVKCKEMWLHFGMKKQIDVSLKWIQSTLKPTKIHMNIWNCIYPVIHNFLQITTVGAYPHSGHPPPFFKGGGWHLSENAKRGGIAHFYFKGVGCPKGGGSFIKGGDGQFLLHIFENPLSFDRFIKSHSQKYFISI